MCGMNLPDLSRAQWRKSSHSSYNGECVEVTVVGHTQWRKSTHSSARGACVEVAQSIDGLPGVVAIRDSKNRDGPKLAFTPAQWQTFTTTLRTPALNPR